jgi:hypothetical protein
MARRREQKADRRLREEERLAAERRRLRNGRLIAFGIAAASSVIVAFALVGRGGPGPPAKGQVAQLRSAAAAAGCSVATFPSEGRTHTESRVTYKTNPPTSGPHNPVPAPDQVYTTAPPKENYVHTLEHGRIELQYRPGAPSAVRDALQAVYDQSPAHVLLFPNNTGMPFEVAATAWKQRLGCPRFDARVPEALSRFRDVYRDRGPEQVP